ncbi:MAG: putative system TPR-repeat lipoprotein [Planctomycetaceae bacterium]|nr:putative system TPR-repeat lipoprotein [Planctomycetaceae bacterium]
MFRNRAERWVWMVIVSLIVVSAFMVGVWRWLPVGTLSTAKLQFEAEQAENAGDLDRAADLTIQYLAREPNDQRMLMCAIRVAVKRRHFSEAVEYFSRFVAASEDGQYAPIPGDDSTIKFAGEAFFQEGYIDAAEKCFRRGLRFNQPSLQPAHTRLAFLLSVEGRRWESVPHLLEQLKHGQTSVDQLLWLGNLQAIVGDDDLLKTWVATDPDGLGPQLGTAVRKLAQHDPVDAARRLMPLAAAHPECVEVGIQLGKAALELGQLDSATKDVPDLKQQARDAFLRWHALRDMNNSEVHPDLWVLRGRWFMTRHDSRTAIRCFAEALRLNPDQQYANYQLAQLLQRESRNSVSQKCVQRADQLSELFRIMNLLYDNRRHIDLLRQAAEQTEALGRLWEAWGWYRMVLAVEPKTEWAWQNSARLRKRLDSERPGRVLPKANPVAELDLSLYPLPDWRLMNEFEPQRPHDADSGTARIQFEDLSHAVGLNFTYFNCPHDGSGERSYEFTGGGIAAIDFDVDGWPDLYFTQGCRLPEQPGQQNPQEFLDRLYRNVEGKRFEDVTAVNRIIEDRFSQGVTVGDYNSDGFPDLYVANIGPNRFMRNNGDGTFSDVTPETGTAGDSWSTSCVMVDINADALPDLYVVNYLTGDDVYTRVCQDPDGSPRMCYPQVFPPAADQFYLNRGDGTFEESSVRSGVHDSTGRGLGIVAANFEGNGRLNLFVANDTTANFYFRNSISRPGELPAFHEEGIASGLAFDASGQAQASMGVAAADVDRDGRLDLFVTNFEREYNNLYLQLQPGLFTDAIATSGLQEAGYLMLGFGTQFLDADLDGWPDLFVANGHIDDFTRRGIAYRMPPQFFRNQGRGAFRELPANSLGQYFEGKYLGRAVARVDWNRDGLDDLAIGHLGSSSVLLTNRTQAAGRFLTLDFRGVTSSRDAIGTRVELQIGRETQHYQLTAGDGYQASNERRLVMGVGNTTRIAQVVIFWPSGLRETFDDITTNTAWTVIEGKNRLVRQK